MKLLRKKEFVAVGLDLEDEIFEVHIASLVISNEIDSSRRFSIVSLKVDDAIITVFAEYSDFADAISPELAAEL